MLDTADSYMAEISGNFKREGQAMRAVWEYNLPAWEKLINVENLTAEEIGARVNVTPRHVLNILNGSTRTCRFKTVKKIRSHLTGNGISEANINSLFKKKGN